MALGGMWASDSGPFGDKSVGNENRVGTCKPLTFLLPLQPPNRRVLLLLRKQIISLVMFLYGEKLNLLKYKFYRLITQ